MVLSKKGFTLIELLVVIVIISIIASISFIFFNTAREKARDAKRKSELVQIARFFLKKCYIPDIAPEDTIGGAGVYDFKGLFDELKAKNPEIDKAITRIPRDPKTGSDSETNYKYIVSSSGEKCSIFANLENGGEVVTLPSLTDPTPGGGSGVLETSSVGWNDSVKYLQYSN